MTVIKYSLTFRCTFLLCVLSPCNLTSQSCFFVFYLQKRKTISYSSFVHFCAHFHCCDFSEKQKSEKARLERPAGVVAGVGTTQITANTTPLLQFVGVYICIAFGLLEIKQRFQDLSGPSPLSRYIEKYQQLIHWMR